MIRKAACPHDARATAAPVPSVSYTLKGVAMIRTLLGVVVSGTLLLGWCWYYSDYLPQHLQQLHVMGPPRTAEGAEIIEPVAVDEQGAEHPQVSMVKAGPLKF